MRLLLVLFLMIFTAWQMYEFIIYGDDASVNIFSTGDYKEIFK